MNTDSIEAAVRTVRTSHLLRLAGVAVLALVLLIPIVLIDGIVGEREARRAAAVDEVSQQWGGDQRLFGPVMVVPYTHRSTDAAGGTARDEARTAVVLPSDLRVTGRLDTATRTRGIFSIPVYTASLTLAGTFARRDLPELGPDAPTAAWDRAQLVLGLSDVRAIQS
ncbi:MAG: inner membrane CreD family protein, partial [Vicinamibacterales bacterium]